MYDQTRWLYHNATVRFFHDFNVAWITAAAYMYEIFNLPTTDDNNLTDVGCEKITPEQIDLLKQFLQSPHSHALMCATMHKHNLSPPKRRTS